MKMSAENPEKDKQITASDIARMTDAEVLEALRSLLDKNMAEFDATLEGLTKEEIAEMPEVAARGIYIAFYNMITNLNGVMQSCCFVWTILYSSV